MSILSFPPLSLGDRFEDEYEVILILDDREQFATQGLVTYAELLFSLRDVVSHALFGILFSICDIMYSLSYLLHSCIFWLVADDFNGLHILLISDLDLGKLLRKSAANSKSK